MASFPPHQCPVEGCTTSVPYTHLLCRGHWARVPIRLRHAVWGEWRGGDPTVLHSAACDEAIAAVNEKVRARVS
jgi:hypothetical protein